MDAVPFESGRWSWETALPQTTQHLGRDCVLLESSTATLADVELVDGVIEIDLAVGRERGFHGVAFSGERAEVYVRDMHEPALAIRELKGAVAPGRVGVFADGAAIHLSGFAYDATGNVAFRREAPAPGPALDGLVPAWSISDAFAEGALATPHLDRGHLEARTWTRLTSEPSGLVDLARVNGLRDGRNTVFARSTIHRLFRLALPAARGRSERAGRRRLGGSGRLGSPGEVPATRRSRLRVSRRR
jgi:hypothetical protein